MARKKKTEVEKVEGLDLSNTSGDTVLVWKVNRPLSDSEHEMLVNRIRSEEEHTGVKIMLIPFSVDAEVQQTVDDTGDNHE